LGTADDPNVNDYYNNTGSFPIAYSAEDDPDVIDDMQTAMAELKDGSDEGDIESMSDGSTSSEDSEGCTEDGWEDEDDVEAAVNSTGQPKKKKWLSSVDKVR
jgi:hypothetical protein